jgi:hypothetical protein
MERRTFLLRPLLRECAQEAVGEKAGDLLLGQHEGSILAHSQQRRGFAEQFGKAQRELGLCVIAAQPTHNKYRV